MGFHGIGEVINSILIFESFLYCSLLKRIFRLPKRFHGIELGFDSFFFPDESKIHKKFRIPRGACDDREWMDWSLLIETMIKEK